MKNEVKGKLTIGERIGLLVAALSIASGVTLYSHSQTNHLNKKCPLADLYGDKVIEHSINEVKKHTTNETVSIIPEGYKYNPNVGLWTKTENGITYTTNGDYYRYVKIYGKQAESYYGIDANLCTAGSVENQIEEQVKSLYR